MNLINGLKLGLHITLNLSCLATRIVQKIGEHYYEFFNHSNNQAHSAKPSAYHKPKSITSTHAQIYARV